MALLTGCRGVGQEPVNKGALNNIEQDGMIVFSDLEKELQEAGMNFERVSEDDSPITEYIYKDGAEWIMVSLHGLTSPDNQIIRQIIIQSQLDLSQNPMVKILAPIIGEEKLLNWLKEQEKQVAQANEEKIIQDVLALDRNYIFYESWPGHEERVLEFTWAPKPRVSIEFKAIERQLEEHNLLVTDYIEGLGGQTLTATNSDYYSLTKMRHNRDNRRKGDVGQAVAYKVMVNKDKPNNYSVQLYGYMEEDLSYKTKVETMPGLDEITKLMNMDHESFSKIMEKVNEELTKARELQNYNLQREYYSEGDIGEYHYIVMVPEGFDVYRFTVLIE